MKSSKFILAMWLGASAWAQTPPHKVPVSPTATAAKPNSVKSAPAVVPVHPAPASHTVAAAHPPMPVAKASAGREVKAGRRRSVKLVAKRPSTATNLAAIPSAETAERKSLTGRRDPFVSPVVERIRTGCTAGGRQCLLVNELTLQGVVRSSGGLIAVVMNGEHTYFLHENDPLANGTVERITRDTIVMRERTSDALGRPFTREVVRKLGTPAA